MELLAKFLRFCAIYETLKCGKTMICGSVFLLIVFLLHGRKRKVPVWLRYYSFFLLFPMALMGMSKLFFVKPFVNITVWMHHYLKPIYAEFYMAVMLLLLLVFCGKHLWLRFKIHRLTLFSDIELRRQALACVTAGARTGLRRKYLQRVRIYVTKNGESPFSGGIFRPYIVLPEKILSEWQQEKCLTVICHELIHISSGHIVVLTLFELLKIYWWINPFLYLCEHMLREDIELLCDEACLAAVGVSRMEYGTILLEMITILSGVRRSETAAFMERNNFLVLKRRIGHLGEDDASKLRKRKKRISCCFCGVMAVLLFVIHITSYPRYTVMTEISLYNEKLELLAYDTPSLRDAVKTENGRLVLNEERFGRILEEAHVDGEYVYVAYDTIMKVPGVGGCGNTGMIAVDDLGDIFYLRAETWENDFMEFFLKYLL